MPDALDAAFKYGPVSIAMFRVIERSEAKTVHSCDGAGPHRKNIPQDTTDARGRSLKRFDKARMIVRFNLERNAPVVTDIDYPGIFTRRHYHTLSGCGKPL